MSTIKRSILGVACLFACLTVPAFAVSVDEAQAALSEAEAALKPVQKAGM